jgi:hypothetical protein
MDAIIRANSFLLVVGMRGPNHVDAQIHQLLIFFQDLRKLSHRSIILW